jgi:hypothetical protein
MAEGLPYDTCDSDRVSSQVHIGDMLLTPALSILLLLLTEWNSIVSDSVPAGHPAISHLRIINRASSAVSEAITAPVACDGLWLCAHQLCSLAVLQQPIGGGLCAVDTWGICGAFGRQHDVPT